MRILLADTLLAVAASPAASLVAKATLTLALALLLARTARRSRAAVRHVLLAAAFASLLILPGASLVLPSIAVEVPVAAHTATNASLPQPHVAITAPAPVGAGVPSDIAAPGTSAVSSRSIGAAIWGVGALIFLVPVAAGIWQTRRLLRRSAAWTDGQDLAQRLAADIKVRRPVDIRLHESVPGPMTCGVFRPAIVLPHDAPTWSGDELQHALIHELEHVRRGDWTIQCAARAICAFYWFHPLVWIAWRQLALEAERACDDAVVRRAEATAYAEQLVGLAQRLSARSSRPVLAMAAPHDLGTRVRALLDSAQARGRAGRACVAAVATAALLLVAALAPLRAVAPVQGSAAAENDPPLAFEVASIRKNTSGVNEQFVQREPGGRVTIRNFPLRGIIQFAYQVQPFQLQGGPEWLTSDRFDIVARADVDPGILPSPEAPDPVRLMLRTLLADRFELAIRKEVQEMPIFELRPARRDGTPGPELRQSETDCVALAAAAQAAARTGGPRPSPRRPDGSLACGATMGFGTIQAGGITLARFGDLLSPLAQRIVVDRTGMTGNYDLALTYAPDPAQIGPGGLPAGVELPAIDPDTPSLFVALQEQLGLKLEAARGPVEVLVIDSVEQPLEN